jgi:hypothetical protein
MWYEPRAAAKEQAIYWQHIRLAGTINAVIPRIGILSPTDGKLALVTHRNEVRAGRN